MCGRVNFKIIWKIKPQKWPIYFIETNKEWEYTFSVIRSSPELEPFVIQCNRVSIGMVFCKLTYCEMKRWKNHMYSICDGQDLLSSWLNWEVEKKLIIQHPLVSVYVNSPNLFPKMIKRRKTCFEYRQYHLIGWMVRWTKRQ